MIEIRGVRKAFDDNQVLNGVDLEVEKGQTCVIIGRSGCGKSVLLKQIVGILKPDAGVVMVNGLNLSKLSDKKLDILRMKIGMVFQGGALFDSLTVSENVGFALTEHTRIRRRDINKRVVEALELVGLKGIENVMPAALSGGMRKRVALARAICMKPAILLYDEPTTGVDPITADSINDLIIEMRDRLNVTSIVVTHDMRSAYKVADKIAMLYQGKIIAEGTARQIQNSAHAVVHQFINGLATGPITDK